MNIVILALIAALQKEVALLEAEFAQLQATQVAVVATTTFLPPQEILPPAATPQPILQSVTPTVYVPAPAPLPLTTAWIQVNGVTGTVQLKPGTYAANETWGSTNATQCTVGGSGWSGDFGTSGEKNSGTFQHPTNTVSIICTGNNNASSSVTVITQ